MVAASHNDAGLIRTRKHADNKFVYNRIHALIYKWLQLLKLRAMSKKLLKIIYYIMPSLHNI